MSGVHKLVVNSLDFEFPTTLINDDILSLYHDGLLTSMYIENNDISSFELDVHLRDKRDCNDAIDLIERLKETSVIKNNNIVLSQSITKDLGLYVIDDQLEQTEYCPYFIYRKHIVGDIVDKDSKSMIYGRYFETKLLGSSAKGQSCDSVPVKKDGTKYVDHERCDIQVDRMYGYLFAHGVEINEFNVQVPLVAKYSKGIWLRGEMDIFPTPVNGQISIIDIKTTKDVYNDFFSIDKKKIRFSSNSCWGNFDRIAKNQPLIYHFLARNFESAGHDVHVRMNPNKKDVYESIFNRSSDYSDTNFWYFVAGTGVKEFKGQLAKFEYEYTPMREQLLNLLVQTAVSEISNCLSSSFHKNMQVHLCDKCPLREECFKSS